MNDKHSLPSFKLDSMLRTYSLVGPCLVCFWSLLILVGWWLDIAWLKNPFPDRPVAPASAVLFIICATALIIIRQSAERWARKLCKALALVTCLCGVAILGHLLGFDFDLEQLFSAQPLRPLGPGRMAIFAAVNFTLMGPIVYLFTLGRKRARILSLALIVVVLAIALTALTGYIYDRSADFAQASIVPMAMPAAIMFTILAVVVLALDREFGLHSLLVSEAEGGRLFRIYLPFAVCTPLIGGWLRLVFQHAGLSDTAFGVSLMVVLQCLVLACCVYFATRSVERTDLGRISAQAQLKKEKQLLEAILNSLAEGVIVADSKGVFLKTNRAATEITGIEANDQAPEFWAQKWGIYFPDGVTQYSVMDLPLVRAMRGESVDNVDVFVRNSARPHGVLINVSARPLRSESSGYSGGVLILRDVTRKKRSNRELRRSKTQLMGRRLSSKRVLRGGSRLRRPLGGRL